MEEFVRWESMIGTEGLQKLRNASVLIIGLGGVGGFSVEMLARCGVGRLILVDHDTIDLSNLNRQIIALHSTVGSKKVDVCKMRILDINPCCDVLTYDLFYQEDTKQDIWKEKIDFVIDACDTIDSKKSIIRECILRKIPFVSCMGTGRKMDPRLLNIVELEKTNGDPIARILRKWKKDEGIKENIMVLSSSEIPKKQEGDFIPSNCFVPSVAGILMARYVVERLFENEK